MNSARRAVLSALAALALAALGCGVTSPAGNYRPVSSETPASKVQEAQTVVPSPTSPDAPGASPQPPASPLPSLTPTPLPRVRSGLRVVYVDSRRDLWIWDQGQEPKLLANTQDVDRVFLSKDGEWILFTRAPDGYSADLWLVRPNGTEGKLLLPSWKLAQLVPVDQAHAVVPFRVQWIQGTHKIAISSMPVLESPVMPSNNDLILLDADSGKLTQVFAKDQAGIFFLAPDGSQFALSYPGRLDLMNSDGSNLRSAVLEYPREFNGFIYYAEPRWSLDGGKMRVVVPPAGSGPGARAAIWEISAGGKPLRLGSVSPDALFSVSFSPDLNSLAYLRRPDSGPEAFRELRVAGGDGGGDRLFATGQLLFEQWAPDSRSFIYDLGMPSRPHRADLQGNDSGEIAPILTHQIRWVDSQAFLYFVEKAKIWELHLAGPGLIDQVLVSFPQVKAYPSFDFLP